jgi:hypothetical protein
LNLPNTLTLSRIFIVPLLVVVLLTPLSQSLGVPPHILGVAIFALAALTDFFDGRIARSRKQVSKLGKLLDPIADKLADFRRADCVGRKSSGAGVGSPCSSSAANLPSRDAISCLRVKA